MWQLSLERLHVRLPSPLPHDLMVKHAVLLLVAGFAVQQLSGQLWRMFVSGVSGQVSLMETRASQAAAVFSLGGRSCWWRSVLLSESFTD